MKRDKELREILRVCQFLKWDLFLMASCFFWQFTGLFERNPFEAYHFISVFIFYWVMTWLMKSYLDRNYPNRYGK
jgi:hypothetical protein